MNLVKNSLPSKVFVFFVALLFLPSVALAEWIKVAATLNDDGIFYVSDESIKKTGEETRSAWEVVNHLHKTRQGYLSAKVQQEYDCKSNRVRMLYASSHSELFGKGKTIEIAKEIPLPWQTIPANSVATFARDYICSSRL